MTSTTADGPALADEDLPGREPGPAGGDGDAFDADALPAPRGATRALLISLLAPLRARVLVASLLLLVQQAAVQAGPLLVAYAIDSGVPAFRDHDYGPLAAVGVGYAVCSVGGGCSSTPSSGRPPGSTRTCCSICAGGSSGTRRR